MRLIGITGSSGSGKSTVADYFARLGYTVIDGDAISRQLATPGSGYVNALVQAFGPDICDPAGALCRRAMGELAFSTPQGQKKLTAVTTPFILEEVRRRMAECEARGEQLAFLDGAVILGTPFAKLCEQVIAVLADPQTQVDRIARRDHISPKAAAERLARQWPNETMQQAASCCIFNTSDKEELLCKAKKTLEKILSETTG